ncbi:MAG: arginine--tRNA ligase [Thermoleophilaceae bacterium]|nr:arginine--tRNA ligase [Thermoleophilaceae bacterium]
MDPVAELRAAVAEAAGTLAGGEQRLPGLERPPKPDFGDYSTNAAMLLAPVMSEPPRGVAEKLGELLGERLAGVLERVEVAGPGFLNLFVSDEWLRSALAGMVAAEDGYGGGVASEAERVLVEFVSANPTGPVTVASGRHAAYGDSLARILDFAGHDVEREFYVNDYGSQMRRLGESIKARARGEEPPTDGYHGGYVTELAEKIDGAAESDVDELATQSATLILESVEATLERFRVHFDRFFSERSLHEADKLRAVLTLLEEKELAYPSEGAVWMRTTEYGDDKDRVLMRSNGEMTYFTADIAYHRDKLERGYDRAIDVLGADHHGHVTRMLAAWDLLGGEGGTLELPIMQIVSLMEGGQRVQMSKRGGEFVTLDELIDDIGVDAARFFLLQRSHDTALDLDLSLARDRSQDNPVYYLQYAHARIASILRKAGSEAVDAATAADLAGSAEHLHASACALLKRLLEWPAEVLEAADRRAPHRITVYLHVLAQDFTAFYRDVKVVGAAEEGGDEAFRIAMCVATRRVLARGLDLLGVEAPEEMHRDDAA